MSKTRNADAGKTIDEIRRNELLDALDALDPQLGVPDVAARTWARRVLARSYRVPARR